MSINPLRNGHGAGAGQPHVELPLKDLRPANPEETARNLAERKGRGKPFQKGNKAAQGRAPSLALLGRPADNVPELARKDLRRADRYRQRRVREVAGATGYADAGTCAVLASAALVLASQRQVAARAFETGEPALHKLAADLAEKHSQLELKAAFMAKDAAAARPRDPLAAHRALEAAFGGKDDK
ncbi:MAG: hypothetical protein ACOY0T_09535 [Myxococcota bacterium]